MPCYDPETHNAPIRLKKKLDHVTHLLCALCTAMEREEPLKEPELTDLARWWINHKAWDAERKLVKLKKEAGGTLTQRETSILYSDEHP